ncbi:hypothetical protein GCM10010954_18320 [Halobacillus andaensis]|uniref:DUF2332 domain-containing protein n=2 Tax=Halobacillus andaensis TaxID=1176239 RepID=A0A917B2Y6_HALAA|nr:DUF2332 domain-containing protein [Halobacillus andaensis]MBP2004665.1 hypothetical protein [Halobacillus andaensis]GGF19887.1 hypothetical protein GCM10010954_18320 [Halobacillus andaensis]
MEHLVKTFKDFSQEAKSGSSPLYSYLSSQIAKDHFILSLASYTRKEQPAANLLLASVHCLLLNGGSHPLRNYYPSIMAQPSEEDAFPAFKHFCRAHEKEIKMLLKTKLVQTNEVRRCAYLYPCFSYVYQKTKQPLTLIEIGTSAGFQLNWDRYNYSYNSERMILNGRTNVHIRSTIKGENIPTLPLHAPPINDRYGIDLHINDMNNREDLAWLNALIWPEHSERRELFLKTAETVKQSPMQLIEGDGVELLPSIARKIPKGSTLCVFHTHVANQMKDSAKEKLLDHIEAIGRERNVVHLYNNIADTKLHLDLFVNKGREEYVVGETDGHGRWFTWEITQ